MIDKFKIELTETNKIIPYENNTKIHPDAQIKLIADSIEKFNFDQPIVVDEDFIVIKGHGRLLAAQHLKLDKVPVIIRTDLTEAQKIASRIADNKSNESDWDFPLLNIELEELKDLDFDYDFGFTDDEILTPDTEGLTDDDYIPEVAEPICQTGDLWKLGEHRILCGDATKKEDVERLMAGEKADICFTSPPYNAGSLNVKGNKETQSKYINAEKILDEKDYNSFLIKVFGLAIEYCDEVFINIGLVESNKRSIIYLLNTFIGEFKDIIYWKKSTVAPHIQKGIINNLVEFIFVFGDGKRKFKNANFSQGTCWNVVEGKNASGNEYSDIHKATFPIYLPDFIIRNFTKTKQLVLDNFIGTGSTLIAAEKTGRKCYGLEIDPHYVDVVIQRYEQFTGNKAVKI